MSFLPQFPRLICFIYLSKRILYTCLFEVQPPQIPRQIHIWNKTPNTTDQTGTLWILMWTSSVSDQNPRPKHTALWGSSDMEPGTNINFKLGPSLDETARLKSPSKMKSSKGNTDKLFHFASTVGCCFKGTPVAQWRKSSAGWLRYHCHMNELSQYCSVCSLLYAETHQYWI